jgi:hypothetical protein
MTQAIFAAQKYKRGHYSRDPKNAGKLGTGLKKAWKSGKFKGRKITEKKLESMAQMRSKIDRAKLAKITRDRLLGTHGSGRTERGRADHSHAKKWHLRDPNGRTHRFSNLTEWARQNEHLFHDDRPESKAPFCDRIRGGIANLVASHGRSCSYKGWVVVSDPEYVFEGRQDPLGRNHHILPA